MESIILGVIFTGVLIYQANILDLRGDKDYLPLRLAMYALVVVGLLLGIFVLVLAMSGPESAGAFDVPAIDPVPAFVYFILSVLLAVLGFMVIRFRWARLWLADRLHPIGALYQPDAQVHTVAILLAFFQILNTVGGFLLAGGVEGLASDVSGSAASIESLLMSFLLYVLVALLGVGLYIRRNVKQVMTRLGLTLPSPKSIGWGLVIGFFLFWFQAGMLLVWQSLVSPELLAEQTAAAEQIFSLFQGSVAIALLMAITTGVGEEILFRGALQPIFGNLPVSIFFALLHTQYLFTPAMLIILVVSMGFGWLRTRFDTTTAIVAHFIYNLLPFMLLWIVGT
jgi:hypothetical protein